MSFIVLQPTDHRSSPASFSRCGVPFDVDYNAIPRSLFGAMLGAEDDDDVVFDEAPSLMPWQHEHHQHLEQFRRQQYLQEVERRRRIMVARQQQAELERRVERARLEQLRREKAARLAWHQEQQRRAAVALEYQRRVEAHKRRQQEEYARKVRLAQQAHQARLAAHQAQQQKEIDWEQVATQSIFGVIDLVHHLFGEQQAENAPEATTASKADGKKREKTTEEANTEKVEKRVDADAMQVDKQEGATEQVQVEVKPTEAASEESANAEEVVAASEEATPDSTTEPAAATAAQEEEKQEVTESRLVFTYPLPQDESARSSIKAQDIGVSYDEASHTIQLTGLWPDRHSSPSETGSSDNGHDEGRGRKRSRSPKRSRVSDVDEKTGEEIIQPEENDEGFVEVPEVPSPVTKSIRLPQDATVAHLRAELTDDGFKVYV